MSQRTLIDSSVIAALTYDSDTNVLDVEFRTGRVYRYWLIPQGVYDALRGSDSIGRHFNSEVRDHFPNRELGPDG
ncbi:MAG: KTSC domain-containing protein [Acidobacteriota bacterium]